MSGSGCGGGDSQCTPSERFFADGIRREGDKELLWESSPPSGPFLPFDGETRFHFVHALGAVPVRTDVEIAFTEYPEAPGGGGSVDATGDLAKKLLQNAQEVVVENNTCGNFYVRVVVHATR